MDFRAFNPAGASVARLAGDFRLRFGAFSASSKLLMGVRT
jgi:hypothetical protein